MTIRELSKIAGVSPATISLVLNNKKGVGNQTRERILALLQEHGYTRPPRAKEHARCIRFLKYKEHGLVVDRNEGFVTAIIDSIEAECRKLGYDCTITTAQGSFREAVKSLPDTATTGLIVLGTELAEADYPLLAEITCPYVVVDNSVSGVKCDSVTMDNAEIVYHALKHLKELGHREISYFHSLVSISNFEERRAALAVHCRQLGLSFRQENEHLLTPTLEGAYESMLKLLAAGVRLPSAAFADNDTIAIGAMKAMVQQGYRIPGDISVIGFDDIPFCTMASPALTTMHVPRHTIGAAAVRLLCERIELPAVYHIKLKVGAELVPRQSTAVLSAPSAAAL